MSSLIRLENVDFFYDYKSPVEMHALKGINLEIPTGTYASFLGPSGCGKSTLLYAIAGVERPQSGKVFFNEKNLVDLSESEVAMFRQEGIGIIFQNFNLIPTLKIVDNVMLPMAFLGASLEKRRKRAMEILERLGMKDFAGRYPYELSGGQQQRVGIARALANDPPVILADEPIGNLDSHNANIVLDLLKEIHVKDGKTIIIVTHEPWSLRDVEIIFHVLDGAVTKVEHRTPKGVVEVRPADVLEKALHGVVTPQHAEQIAGLVLRGYPRMEIERLGFLIRKRLTSAVSAHDFRATLQASYQSGGLGLWKQKAIGVMNVIDQIMTGIHRLEDIQKLLEKTPQAPLHSEIHWVTRFIFKEYSGDLSPIQLERAHEVVMERLRGIITNESVLKVLMLPLARGGIGLREQTALKALDRFNIFLASDVMPADGDALPTEA